MKIETEVFPVPTIFGRVNPWQLWFISDCYYPDHKVVCHNLSVKPTKKQIRKLRREFCKP